MPRISVIVPVYKAEAFLDRCVNSILNQSFTDFELLLVNDGSPDRSGEMCEEYAKQDSRIRVFHKENGGQATARNLAIEWALAHSDSQWLAFIDSDDWVHTDYLTVLINSAQKWNTKVAVCNFVTTAFFCEDICLDGLSSTQIESEQAIVDYYNMCMSPCCKIYEKELFRSIRFAEGKTYEDAFITHIPILKAGKIAVFDAQLYYYYENQDSTTRKKWSEKSLAQIEAHEARLEYCRKNGYNIAYPSELKAYISILFGQAAEIHKLRKQNLSYQKYYKIVRPKLLPALKEAQKFALYPFCYKYLWIYELAYPITPVWKLRNMLEKVFGIRYPK